VTHPLWGSVLGSLGAVVCVWAWIETTRAVPGPIGIVLASLLPLVPLGVLFGVVWWRGARLRRRLLDAEFRDT